MRCLAVDDSRATRTILRRYLSQLGLEADVAESAREALRRMDGGMAFDCLLVDWNMPDMNGLELIVELRARGVAIPIVLVTSQTNVEQVDEALRAGANEYIMKPFDLEILRSKLELLGILVTG